MASSARSCAWGGVLIPFVLLGGMGAGDVKLFALLGLVIGFPNVILAFLWLVCLGAWWADC